MDLDTIWPISSAGSIATFYGELSWWLERHCLCTLPGWYYYIQGHIWGTHWKYTQGFSTTERAWSKTETSKMQLELLPRYVNTFSRIAKPIFDLVKTPGQSPPKTQQSKYKGDRRNRGQLPAKYPVEWTDIHQSLLEILIDSITSVPVMAYPDFQEPFVLHTDAS